MDTKISNFSTPIHRRFFLGAASAAAPLAFGISGVFGAQNASADGLIERLREPPNLEFPFHTLDRFVIPNDRFFVRCHFAIPTLEPRTWRLSVEGAVERPISLSLEDLRRMPSRTVTATLECAGNSRALNDPPLRGVGWRQGAVSNAEWTGVPLAAILERAGVRAAAVEVVLEGADRGEISSDPRPAGPITFARSLPIAKARQDEVVLAHQMNGVDLPAAHGFPLRAVVPGWYGMASVKWLTRILVAPTPFQGFWQTTDYSIFERVNGLPVQQPITEMQIKSLIAQPRSGDTVRAGAECAGARRGLVGGIGSRSRRSQRRRRPDLVRRTDPAAAANRDAALRLAALGIHVASSRRRRASYAACPRATDARGRSA